MESGSTDRVREHGWSQGVRMELGSTDGVEAQMESGSMDGVGEHGWSREHGWSQIDLSCRALVIYESKERGGRALLLHLSLQWKVAVPC